MAARASNFADAGARARLRLHLIENVCAIRGAALVRRSAGRLGLCLATRTGPVAGEYRLQTQALRAVKRHRAWLWLGVQGGAANFLLCSLAQSGPDATAIIAACRRQGLFLRDATRFRRWPESPRLPYRRQGS
jgi:hypothetical protein